MVLTDTVIISLVGAAATVIVSMVNAGFAWLGNARAKRNEGHLVETKEAVAMIQTQTNGMSDKIATLAGEKGVLEGHAQGMLDAGAVPVMIQQSPEPEVKRSLLEKLTGK